MKIDILCTDGSPLGVTSKDIWGEGKRGVGVGGAELALLTMCEEWSKAGHEVCLYNDPYEYGASPFEQRPIYTFESQADRDVLIVFRTPNAKAVNAKGLKCWFSCDQYTSAPFAEFAPLVDKIVVISPFHANHFRREYGIHNTTVIDLPVRVDDYDPLQVEKVPGRCIFTSVPDRGLKNLWFIWPVIKRDNPHATLVITSDYRLWGTDTALNETHRANWIMHALDYGGVDFRGAVSRRDLIVEQSRAQIHLYPCDYEELFCIAVAESQYAGAVPVTTTCGALETTNMGIVLKGDVTSPEWNDRFIAEATKLLSDDDYLALRSFEVKQKAKERFHPARILAEWDEKVFK